MHALVIVRVYVSDISKNRGQLRETKTKNNARSMLIVINRLEYTIRLHAGWSKRQRNHAHDAIS